MADWIAESELYCKRSKIGNVEEVFESNGYIEERYLRTRLERCAMRIRRRRFDHRQMYLYLSSR